MAEDNAQIGLFEQPVSYQYEVFLTILRKLEEDALELRRKTEIIIGPDKQKYFRPHISFLSFKQKASKETIFQKLQIALSNFSPVAIKIDGFRIYDKGPRGQAIVLHVAESDDLKNLYSLIQSTFHSGKMTGLHLTIMRTVYLNNHEVVLDQLNELGYSGIFRCAQLTLLRRPTDSKGKYEEVGVLNLGSKAD